MEEGSTSTRMSIPQTTGRREAQVAPGGGESLAAEVGQLSVGGKLVILYVTGPSPCPDRHFSQGDRLDSLPALSHEFGTGRPGFGSPSLDSAVADFFTGSSDGVTYGSLSRQLNQRFGNR